MLIRRDYTSFTVLSGRIRFMMSNNYKFHFPKWSVFGGKLVKQQNKIPWLYGNILWWILPGIGWHRCSFRNIWRRPCRECPNSQLWGGGDLHWEVRGSGGCMLGCELACNLSPLWPRGEGTQRTASLMGAGEEVISISCGPMEGERWGTLCRDPLGWKCFIWRAWLKTTLKSAWCKSEVSGSEMLAG